jgi:hypothetical protein
MNCEVPSVTVDAIVRRHTLITVEAVPSESEHGLPFEYTSIGSDVPGLGMRVEFVAPRLKSP